MIAIVAVDSKWGIGKDGHLLTHLPGDLAYFREVTWDGILVMGRKTAESMPGGKPLPGRQTVVLTRSRDFTFGDALIAEDIEDILDIIDGCGKNVYVCGGGETYRLLLPYCGSALVTKIEADLGADTFFPDLDADADFHVVYESGSIRENGLEYSFNTYDRI